MTATIRTLKPKQNGREGEIVLDYENRAPMITPGEYQAIYTHHETKFIYQCPKVFVWFRVVSPGPAFDVMVYRAYRVRALTTKAGKHGGFKASRGSDIFHDLGRILDMRLRPDRVSARALAGVVYRVAVRTVVKDHKQRPIPEWAQYSVIDKLLSAETETKHLACSS
jgi:hypothetical protein